jgi:predicted AAA+ superfamily ATPase
MKERIIGPKVRAFAQQYPVVTLTGPRQSGKTTLCRALFADKPYANLESPETRSAAISDPKGFLRRYPDGAILDEIQRVPELLSYIQMTVDERQREGMFILTGSHNLLLMQGVSQSLAGRTALATLLPFAYSEAYAADSRLSKEHVLHAGFYPRVLEKGLDPHEAYGFYLATYVERDLRDLLQVRDLRTFEVFLRLCAARTGQLLNLSALGSDCGVSHTTVRHWLSILETGYIIRLVPPYHRNFGKRLVKSHKLYFLDTGLACCLLGIATVAHLDAHPLRGALFETFVMGELIKSRLNRGLPADICFYRDSRGHEVDAVIDECGTLSACEIKLGETIHSDLLSGLRGLQAIADLPCRLHLVYGGEDSYAREGICVHGWREASCGL